LIHFLGLEFPPPLSDVPFIVHMYDLAAWRYQDEAELPEWTTELLSRAATVLTTTEAGAADLERELGIAASKIRVMPLGPGQHVTEDVPRLAAGELRRLGLHPPVVLRLGGFTERKNVPLLLAAWPEIRAATGATLALVGPRQALRDAQLAAAPSLDGVVVLDGVPNEQAVHLLRSADVLVSTSTYEGFGLPPLEAMYAGVPVVAVRTPSVEEVCASAAFLVENDQRALATALIRVLRDSSLRESLVAAGRRQRAGFTWEATAGVVTRTYEEIASERLSTA
jgi:glycosyltransferase involved in cell wall biosynthesis